MRKGIIIICMMLLIFIYLININFLLFPKSRSLTGSGITASVSLTIAGEYEIITIASPLNQTYNFGIGDNYTLDLNVTANFNPSSWSYSLWDLKHNIKVNDSIAFSPNTTFNAVRWSNELIVHAVNSTGDTVNESVTFFISVPNSAPYFGYINSTMSVCENNALSYDFNVTDVDEQVLQLSLTPTDPFYLDTVFTSDSVKTSFIELFSGIISDTDAVNGSITPELKIYSIGWMTYPETIEVTDQEYSDTAYTNITAIRVNDAPVISTIGVQTVWTRGEDSTFYKQVQVTDEEDGDQDSGELNFTIEFLDSSPMFGINGSGVMNFTPNSSQVGVYTVRVCVNDTGIYNVHPYIYELCGQDGSSITTCQNFSLTVTDENRAPTIVSYYPVDLTLNVSGTDILYFNISEYDPDGTIPDAYWYVDGVVADYDSGSLVDEFAYTFRCGVSGTKTIKAEITDGLLNDSVEWTIDVDLVDCPVPGVPGGGGRAAGPTCREKWVCSIWGVCQNTEISVDVGLLSGEDYRIINEQCVANNWYNEFCGVQIRECFDANSCNLTYYKPSEVQSCYYTEEPNCNDGIKNCHDDACELLIDCGGPCLPCPSCSDKIQNQGEEETDCGGPCPWKCEVELPFIKRFNIWFLLLILIILIILIIIAIRKLRKIHRFKEKLKRGI